MVIKTKVIDIIHAAIEEVWLNNIKNDYDNDWLLREDSLKNSFYFHLRNALTDQFLINNNLRIFTEYKNGGLRADLVIARIDSGQENREHLEDAIIEILAVVEMKYKNCLPDAPFLKDINKVKGYINNAHYPTGKYYLAFIHEVDFVLEEEYRWLKESDLVWAQNKVVELNGYFREGKEEALWEVISY
jgi:hypothetical protein